LTKKIKIAKYEKVLEAFNEGVFKYHEGRVWRMKRINTHQKMIDLPKEEIASIPTKQGYRRINYKRTVVYEHTLIYALFNGIQKLKEIDCVDHINAIKDDNRLENLEGVSNAENNRRAEELNLIARNYGMRNGRGKFTEREVKMIIKLHALGLSQYQIAELADISQSHVSDIVNYKVRVNG
jgi:hypothetical protein